jgi:membrane fusion protein, heavy metal efflux system
MFRRVILLASCAAALLAFSACHRAFDPAAGAPPPATVVPVGNADLVHVDDPSRFPLVTVGVDPSRAQLQVTGSVNPDVAREVPVVSLANGRVVQSLVRLDDHVHQGQLLMQVQSPDITAAFDVYQKAVNDAHLAQQADQRARDLFSHGALAASGLEQADDTAQDAQADLSAAVAQLRTLGGSPGNPTTLVNVYAPISGVIVAQNVTDAAPTGVVYAGATPAYTIADLSQVWILCDVYENDLPQLALGQAASIRPDGYPNQILTGRVSDISPVLDPGLRTAKVRIEVVNPGMLRLGMFVTATFTSRTAETYPVVPATAVLHLHDRDWVFVPAPDHQFRRVEVECGDMLAHNQQQILSGLAPGQRVVADVLELNEAATEGQ